MRRHLEKAALTLVRSLYAISNSTIGIFKSLLFPGAQIPGDARRILVYRVGNIGDIICAIPSMHAIRKNFPGAEISLLSSPGRQGAMGARELLQGAGFIDNMIVYYKEEIKSPSGKLKLIDALKKKRFDLFIELPMDLTNLYIELRNIVFAKLIGARHAFGFNIDTIRLFTRLQSKYMNFDNEVERLLGILKKEQLEIGDIESSLPATTEERKPVDNFLIDLKDKRLIVLNPNAKMQRNRWPVERFAKVGRRVVKNYNAQILIIGARDDHERAEKLKRAIGEGALNVAGRFTLLQTLELIRRSQLLITNDTGTVHMAALAGTPVIGIYSAWQLKGKWFPYGCRNIILRKEPECHTCYRSECRHSTCLKDIDAEEVYTAVKEIFL